MDMNKKYIAPGRNKDSFTCPHCHAISLMRWSFHHFQEDTGNIVEVRNGGKEYLNELYIARCVNCGKKIIWINKENPENVNEKAEPPKTPVQDYWYNYFQTDTEHFVVNKAKKNVVS